MQPKTVRFKIADALLLIMTVLPLVVAMVLKILFSPATEGISITGALVYFTIPMPLQDLPVSEAQVNSALVVLTILFFCLYMTHGIRAGVATRRQAMAEWAVETLENMIRGNMGDFFMGFAPLIGAILALSAISSLSSLLGIFAPTADVNVVAGWAILVFILITYYKLKGGLLNYLLDFTKPIFIMLPLNVLGEVATPVSMTFRHYGNVLSGSVISVLIAAALQGASATVMGWLPDAVSQFPILRIGLPAILSLYFDVFSSCMQAYIFAMLTMLNVSGGFPEELYAKRQKKKEARRARKASREA